MPLYDYTCGHCGHTFDKQMKIADREKPLSEPCPECGVTGEVTKNLNAVPLNYSGCMTNFKPGDTFSDKLREIKKAAGKHSTIDV